MYHQYFPLLFFFVLQYNPKLERLADRDELYAYNVTSNTVN